MTNDEREVPIKLSDLDEASQRNVIVQRMVRDHLVFTRATYIDLFYDGAVPRPWTFEHEARLPPVFRDDNAEQVREAIEGLGAAIGVTPTGEIPR